MGFGAKEQEVNKARDKQKMRDLENSWLRREAIALEELTQAPTVNYMDMQWAGTRVIHPSILLQIFALTSLTQSFI